MTRRQPQRKGPSPLQTEILLMEDLRILSGRHHISTVEEWARAQGIRFKYDANGGIWTTVAALNAALGVGPQPEDDPLPLDIFCVD